MFQKCGFADATSELKDADYVVVGLPFDSTASFRSGSREGPEAIRLASFNFESYDRYYDVDLADLNICDLGNMELGADPDLCQRNHKRGHRSAARRGCSHFFRRRAFYHAVNC